MTGPLMPPESSFGFSPEQEESFRAAARPLVEWIALNCHPHYSAIVTCTSAELMEGCIALETQEYLRD